MSLLTLVQDAADRLGVVRPSSVIGSSDQQVRQLLALAQQEGKALGRRFDWDLLRKEKTFTATATETQSSACPTDLDRFVPETFWNRTAARRVQGPLSSQEWQNYKAQNTNVIFDAFARRGSSTDLLLAPTPSAGDTYAYEYFSTYWCTSVGGTTGTQTAWAVDTDIGILSEEIINLGVIWRFKAEKGLSYAEDFRAYETAILQQQGWNNASKRTVNMAQSRDYRGPARPTWPDGSWSIT